MFICIGMLSEPETGAAMDELLAALRAVAETTRLRLLVLCARGELTVTELAQILGQSQPRVSRHLKLLCEAGLLDRFREGSWVFYRLAAHGAMGALGRHLVAACGEADETIALDLQRLAQTKRQRPSSPPPISARMPRSGTRSARSISTSARSKRL